MNYFVVDVGGTFVKYAVMNAEGEFIEKGKFPSIADDRQRFLDSIETQFHACEEKYGSLAGIAISMAGILDVETGYAYSGGAIFCVNDMNIAAYFSEKCGVPVTIENDAKAAALAELWRGNLSDARDGVVIVIGTAIGGAVIIDRKVVRGKDFFAGEFSYILRRDGENRDFSYIWGSDGGARGLIGMIAEKKSIPYEEMDGFKAFELINSGDQEAVSALHVYCAGLATRIWNLHAVLNPDRFLIGGGISEQPILLETLREEIGKIMAVMPNNLKEPEVMTCMYFNDSNLIGALYGHLVRYPA